MHRLRDVWRCLPVSVSTPTQLSPATLLEVINRGSPRITVAAAAILADDNTFISILVHDGNVSLKLPGVSGELMQVEKVFLHDMCSPADALAGMQELHPGVPHAVARTFGE